MLSTVIRNGHVIDPSNGVNRVCDVLLKDGLVDAVGVDLAAPGAEEVDAQARIVIPGIIDCHVHLSNWLGGAPGHRMLALAGVTTALDLAGPIDDVTRMSGEFGCGLTIGCIDYVRPGHTVGSPDPSEGEIRDALGRAIRSGAIGQKILGGHFPLTPEASARVMKVAADMGTYVAFHAGTLEMPQNIQGMRQACELAQGHPLHLAHINSYARGLDAPAHEEAVQAIRILEEFPNVWSESYLAPFNGNSGKCADGVPESVATRRNLQRGGFSPTQEGLQQAISAGWALVHVEVDGLNQLVEGDVGVRAWLGAGSDIGISFYANPFDARVKLVTDKREDGGFSVDALATDGGGIPRNDLCSRGLALTRLDAITLEEFVKKVCVAPARMLGIDARKGHLAPGADADVTIIDAACLEPVSSFAHGKAVLRDGEVVGSRGQFLALKEGRKAVESHGLTFVEAPVGGMLRRDPGAHATVAPYKPQ